MAKCVDAKWPVSALGHRVPDVDLDVEGSRTTCSDPEKRGRFNAYLSARSLQSTRVEVPQRVRSAKDGTRRCGLACV